MNVRSYAQLPLADRLSLHDAFYHCINLKPDTYIRYEDFELVNQNGEVVIDWWDPKAYDTSHSPRTFRIVGNKLKGYSFVEDK